MGAKVHQLKITLREIKPAIWRRFFVPSAIPLDYLHDVIQVVMGWTDCHLHEFGIGGARYTEFLESPDDGERDELFRLGDLVKRKGEKFTYLYDFGDSWFHDVEVEKIGNADPRRDELVGCLAGARACPPEDVGSYPGYMDFCEAIRDPGHPEHESMRGWIGNLDFDPDYFNLAKVNFELRKFERWTRPRSFTLEGE